MNAVKKAINSFCEGITDVLRHSRAKEPVRPETKTLSLAEEYGENVREYGFEQADILLMKRNRYMVFGLSSKSSQKTEDSVRAAYLAAQAKKTTVVPV